MSCSVVGDSGSMTRGGEESIPLGWTLETGLSGGRSGETRGDRFSSGMDDEGETT